MKEAYFIFSIMFILSIAIHDYIDAFIFLLCIGGTRLIEIEARKCDED